MFTCSEASSEQTKMGTTSAKELSIAKSSDVTLTQSMTFVSVMEYILSTIFEIYTYSKYKV